MTKKVENAVTGYAAMLLLFKTKQNSRHVNYTWMLTYRQTEIPAIGSYCLLQYVHGL